MPNDQAEPTLKRVLSRRDLVLYGLVLLGPTAAYPVFGILQVTSAGHAALSFLVAVVAMLFTAASYGKMSGAFPSAGSTYTYAQQGLSPAIGFIAGWAMILDYFLIPLLSIVYVGVTAHRLLPHVPYWAWTVSLTMLITAINVRGIRVTAQAGNVMMALMTFCAILFVIVTGTWIVFHHGFAGLFDLSGLYRRQTFSVHALMGGAAIASISYIGFDAISTLAEDTINPERDISFATILVCLLQAVFCVLTVYLAALVWPDFHTFTNPETAILDVALTAGGKWMMGFLVFILLVAGLASALTGQAGASRLLLGMGRDGVISRRIFAHVDPRFSTPTRGIYVMGLVSLIGSLFMRFQDVAELLNFGAFIGFILVNLSVIRHFYFRLHQRSGLALFTNLASPLAGTVVCTYVWINLSFKARVAGFVWLAIGVIYLAVITRGFRVAPKSMSSLGAVES
jgi:amino acid transporter